MRDSDRFERVQELRVSVGGAQVATLKVVWLGFAFPGAECTFVAPCETPRILHSAMGTPDPWFPFQLVGGTTEFRSRASC